MWRAGGRRSTVILRLASGPRFQLRPGIGSASDYAPAYDVFAHGYYDLPEGLIDPAKVRSIYDLGCNVGFSCLHWLCRYPNARIVGYEPHPGHVGQARINLALNGWGERVELHQSGASVRHGTARLSDRGAVSRVLPGHKRGIEIRMEDFFERGLRDDIDILKIDIEGSEYPLMDDCRFDRLRVHVLIIEWHESRGDWTRNRLKQSGYEIADIFDDKTFGMLLATKP